MNGAITKNPSFEGAKGNWYLTRLCINPSGTGNGATAPVLTLPLPHCPSSQSIINLPACWNVKKAAQCQLCVNLLDLQVCDL